MATNTPVTAADLPASARRLIRGANAPRGRASFTDASTSDKWWVPIGDLGAFLSAVGGDVSGGTGGSGSGSGSGSGLARVIPMANIEFPWMLASDVEWQLAGWDGAAANPNPQAAAGGGYFEGAFVTVNYKRFPWDTTGDDAFLTITGRPSETSISLPAAPTAFDGDSSKPIIDPGWWLPGYTYDVTFHRLATFDESLFFGYLGAVNSDTFRNLDAGYVKTHGPGFTRTTTLGNVTTYEVSMSFEVRSIPWNAEVRYDGTADLLKVNGDYRYTPMPFAALFA